MDSEGIESDVLIPSEMDWSKVAVGTLYGAAKSGIPEAVEEMDRWNKDHARLEHEKDLAEGAWAEQAE